MTYTFTRIVLCSKGGCPSAIRNLCQSHLFGICSPANVIPIAQNGKYRDMVNMSRTNVHFRFQTQRDFATMTEGFYDDHSAHTSASMVIQ
jgi:hypothetical protein